jgi:hypothetical protein
VRGKAKKEEKKNSLVFAKNRDHVQQSGFLS